MPRVNPRDVARAGRMHPLLPKLMGVCRTVDASRRELRWLEDEILRQDAQESSRLLTRYKIPWESSAAAFRKQALLAASPVLPGGKWKKTLLQKFVEERSKGTPLSLVVGN
jgi:hypothetical protein